MELNEDQLLLLMLTSVRLARRQHLVECRLLVWVDAEIPLRLYPDPAPRVLAPVVAVGRFPRLRPLIAFDLICRVVGGEEHLRVVGVLFPIGGTPRGRTCPGAPGVSERNHVVDVDLGRIGQRPPHVRIEPRPGRCGAVFVDLDALAVPDQRGVPDITGVVRLRPTVARRVRGPVRELLSGVSRHASRRGDREFH